MSDGAAAASVVAYYIVQFSDRVYLEYRAGGQPAVVSATARLPRSQHSACWAADTRLRYEANIYTKETEKRTYQKFPQGSRAAALSDAVAVDRAPAAAAAACM